MNKKSNLRLLNRTNYFNPEVTKVSLEVLNPSTFRFKSVKRDGYEARLYWEYQNCISKDGQVFFYTLTYNDAHCPHYEGISCFDYNDLVYFLNGGFKKWLLRHYGSDFKYFVGAELGNGAGSRGLENNPHYHCLFFLYPTKNKDYTYQKISPADFRHLVRKYWQGFDEDTDGWHSYKVAKFGIAKEGNNLGLVIDYRAILYCAKYVTKDVSLQKFEKKLKRIVFERRFAEMYKDEVLRNNFFMDVPFSLVHDPGDLPSSFSPGSFKLSVDKVFQFLSPKLFSQVHDLLPGYYLDFFDSFLKEANLEQQYIDYVTMFVDGLVREELNVFRNRYSNKCRISHGVGDYALDFLDPSEPLIKVPGVSGFQYKPLSLYYYRKLFYDVKKDDFGRNIYVINQKGIDYKCRQLQSQIESLDSRLNGLINRLIDCPSLFNQLCPGLSIDDIKYAPRFLYCIYTFVYKGRYFKDGSISLSDSSYPFEHYIDDYRKFLTPGYSCADYNGSALFDFVNDDKNGYTSFSHLSVFSQNLDLFRCLDSLLSYLFIASDDRCEEVYNEIKRVKSFHDKTRLKTYYSNF